MTMSDLPPASFQANGYTVSEQQNMDLIVRFLAEPKPIVGDRRAALFHPGYAIHRWGMANLQGMRQEAMESGVEVSGYDAGSMVDRADTLVYMLAKSDMVWAVFRLEGTHTGTLWGVEASGRQMDLLELGVFRIEDGLIADAWFMNDELAICRQLGLVDANVLWGKAK